MSASWHLSLGYDSKTEIGWQRLRTIAVDIALNHSRALATRALSDGSPGADEDGTTIRGYVEKLLCEARCADRKTPPSDLTFVIYEDNLEPGDRYISMTASGGGLGRKMKECLRRALCATVLERANQMQLNVNIEVV